MGEEELKIVKNFVTSIMDKPLEKKYIPKYSIPKYT